MFSKCKKLIYKNNKMKLAGKIKDNPLLEDYFVYLGLLLISTSKVTSVVLDIKSVITNYQSVITNQ